MKNLLIPTDFSANSWNALEYAVRFFMNEACNFYILHIGDLKESSVNSNSFTFPVEKISTSIKEKLNSLFIRIEGLPINEKHHFIALQEYGNFVDIMRKTVEAKKIDLMVMGTKGASGIKASIVGSNTGDAITKVPCNVLVIPEYAKITIPKKIVFPTDYNIFYSYAILKALTETIRITKAKLEVLNVLTNNNQLTIEQEENKRYLQDYLEETFQHTHSFHNSVNKNIKTAIQHYVASNHGKMVVMVAKNLNFLQNLLFDSSVEKVSFHTTVPVLVMHE